MWTIAISLSMCTNIIDTCLSMFTISCYMPFKRHSNYIISLPMHNYYRYIPLNRHTAFQRA
jgi:hypothetical protein